jgi:putative ABC transport system permease protein
MQSGIINISWLNVGITTLLVFLTGLCSLFLKLRLGRDLFIGTIRTFLQLFLLGYVLKIVFALNNPWIIFSLFSFMIFFAAVTISGRIKEKRVPYFLPVLASIFLSYTVINLFVMIAIVQVKPWYQPVYFIPIGGMIIGNSMNALAIAIDTWFEGIKKERDRIELYLSLGATPVESSAENYKDAIKSGMIPSINALMSVGIVFIPGMMTGQIIAGTLSTIFSLHIVRRLSFTLSHQLKI